MGALSGEDTTFNGWIVTFVTARLVWGTMSSLPVNSCWSLVFWRKTRLEYRGLLQLYSAHFKTV